MVLEFASIDPNPVDNAGRLFPTAVAFDVDDEFGVRDIPVTELQLRAR